MPPICDPAVDDDFNAVQGIDDLGESIEANPHVMVDGQAEVILNRVG